jgi:hypothetical protein
MKSVLQFGLCVATSLVFVNSFSARIDAAEPKWTHRVLKIGADREKTNSTDILLRPYRPMHFYGNTIRRLHYRGQARPTASDMFKTIRYIGPNSIGPNNR